MLHRHQIGYLETTERFTISRILLILTVVAGGCHLPFSPTTIPAYRDPAGFSSSYHQQIYTVHHPVANAGRLSAEPAHQPATVSSPGVWNLDAVAESPSAAESTAAVPEGAGSD